MIFVFYKYALDIVISIDKQKVGDNNPYTIKYHKCYGYGMQQQAWFIYAGAGQKYQMRQFRIQKFRCSKSQNILN